MKEETLLELCPLAALGVLDGEERQAFEREARARASVRSELASFERVASQIGLAVTPVEPRPAVRARVLEEAAPKARLASVSPARGWSRWLPLAAAALLAVGALVFRAERDAARREAARAQAETGTLLAQNRDLQARLDATQMRLEAAEAFRSLVAQPSTRFATLAGLPAAPAARGRVIWSADRREAVLLATGLPAAPAGKAYEAWVIAAGAPVPAGVFRVDKNGSSVHALPRLDDVSRARTFAVTLEPEAGTSAPTGPMVLAGPAL